ncbi:MAG: tRNA pseudouridine(55) synthase TruB [Coriobacteriia bacterium]
MARRGATELSGVLLIDKPSGMTSHDVVSVVRGVTGERRVGHAGTLDPAAEGLLVVLVGPATRLAPYLSAASKRYRARIVFGTATDTDDAEGDVVRTAEVPAALADLAFAREAVERLIGTHSQVPPDYSAIKQGGRTAYKAARGGKALELAARDIEISSAELIGVDTQARAWDVDLQVSKGTYIRAIARDLGVQLGSAAHLGALRRISAGTVTVEQAHTLDHVRALAGSAVTGLFTPATTVLGLPVLELDEAGVTLVRDGRPLPEPQVHGGPIAVVHGGRLLGIYAYRHGSLRPETVFPGGVS